MRRIAFTFAAAAAAATVAVPSFGQDYGFGMIGQQAVSFSNSTLQTVIGNNALEAAVRSRPRANLQGRVTTTAPAMALTPQAGVTGAPQDLTYNASPVLSRQVLDDYLARLGRANPQLARVATDQFARHDYRQIYRGLTRGTGLSENSLTDIMAAYTMLGWMIANNSLANPNPSYLKALRDQLAPVFASNARLAAPQTRGPLAEEMKIHFVTLHAGWQSAQREGRLQQYSDGVASLFRQQGTDLRALTLTPQGFARR